MDRKDRGPIDPTAGAPRARSLDVGGLRVSAASFPAGYRIPSHYHPRACLSVIVEGFFSQRFPGREYDCPSGGVLVKPPGERHDDRWGAAPTHHVIVEPDALDDRLGPVRGVFEAVGHRLDPWTVPLSRRIAGELGRPDDLTPLSVEALAHELVVRVARELDARDLTGDAPPWLRRIRDALHDRYADTPLLHELAAEAGVHASRLSREFRRHFGLSPGAYLRGIRLERAQADLERGDDPLSVVALRHGFADQSHMSRALKRATGLTPAMYRRVHRA